MTDETTVVIADDHPVVRKGLLLLLDAQEGLRVLAEAGTVADALRMARAHRPSVLVLDLHMPDSSGLEAIPLIREQAPMTIGETYLNPRVGARLAAQPPERAGPPDVRSDRELEVLKLIALGFTNAEIAKQLYLSVRTVESHRAHIQEKTRHSSRADLVRYAIEHGLVDLP